MRLFVVWLRLWIVTACALAACGSANADVLGTYSFPGADPAGDTDTPNGNGTAAANITFSSFGRTNLTQTVTSGR